MPLLPVPELVFGLLLRAPLINLLDIVVIVAMMGVVMKVAVMGVVVTVAVMGVVVTVAVMVVAMNPRGKYKRNRRTMPHILEHNKLIHAHPIHIKKEHRVSK
jgi:hypothetical protein